MRILLFIAVAFAASVVVTSCGPKEPAGAGKPSVALEGLTTEQKIEKIQNDPKIPEGYKQTYINSLKAQQGTK